MRITATLTRKGQITIPKSIRKYFKGNILEFVVQDGKVFLQDVPSLAGALAKYSSSYIPLEEVREEIWSKNEP